MSKLAETYELGSDPYPYIKCRVCGKKSYLERDSYHKYCGNCREFHDTLLLRERLKTQVFPYFGIVKDSQGKPIAHRSILKVVFNPFLRLVGVTIATEFDRDTQVLGKPKLVFHKPLTDFIRNIKNSWLYPIKSTEYVEKERVWF